MDVNSLELERAGDSLTGSILVASRLFDGTCNEKIVILVNYHSREFIYGLALNKQATNVDELAHYRHFMCFKIFRCISGNCR